MSPRTAAYNAFTLDRRHSVHQVSWVDPTVERSECVITSRKIDAPWEKAETMARTVHLHRPPRAVLMPRRFSVSALGS
jgi:hypothetical protein